MNHIHIKNDDEKKNIENLINQALGVLAEQGPFAMLLWAKSGKKDLHNKLLSEFPEMLKEIGLADLTASQNLLKDFIDNVCQDFKKLMICRQVFDRVLSYARYYAKAERIRIDCESGANHNLIRLVEQARLLYIRKYLF